MKNSKFTIFNCWQSDFKPSRNAIKTALDKCEKKLREEGYDVCIIQGPDGGQGLCKIDDQVLSNIQRCDIFVCDLSPVAKLNEKLMPNSNVLLELGYAMGLGKQDRIIALVKLEDGEKMEHMPFDINHATIVQFSTPSDINIIQRMRNMLEDEITKRSLKRNDIDYNVTFENGTTEMTGTPKYKHIHYLPSRMKSVVTEKASATAFNAMPEIPQYVQSLIASQNVVKPAKIEVIHKTINRSQIPVNILLSNTGNKVLENFKLEIKSLDESVTFLNSNVKQNLFDTLGLGYSNRHVAENSVMCSEMRVLPTEKIQIDTFFVTASVETKEIVLEWKVTTVDIMNNKSGRLIIKISPCFDTQYVYLDDKVGQDVYEPYITHNDEE